MKLDMNIDQGDNGWVLTFTGHDCLPKMVICEEWGDVLNELEKHFGWWVDDKWVKKNSIA